MKKFYYLFALQTVLFVFLLPVNAQNPYDTGWFEKPVRENYFEISNRDEYLGLVYLSRWHTFRGDTIAILNDLDLSGVSALGEFGGLLLGNGHRISNLKNPMAGRLSPTGVIDNLVADVSCAISGLETAGMFAAESAGVIRNCSNYGAVSCNSSGSSYIGGICGLLKQGGVIVGCRNEGTIRVVSSGDNSVVTRCGGICGGTNPNSEIVASVNSGEISVTAYSYLLCGGVTGDLQSSLAYACRNEGSVTSKITTQVESHVYQRTGGVAGNAQFSLVDNCRNRGGVTNNTGLVAGIVGYAGSTDLYNCLNTGTVASVKYYYFSCANGITSEFAGREGRLNDFFNCINRGKISSISNGYIATAGGVCSDIKNANVMNCLSTGSVSASAPGGHEFTVGQYACSGCNDLYVPVDAGGANLQIDSYTCKRKLLKWKQENGAFGFEDFVAIYVKAFQGVAYFDFYPSSPVESYSMDYDGEGVSGTVSRKNNPAVLSGLWPSRTYHYTLRAEGKNCLMEENGTFTTAAIGLDTVRVVPGVDVANARASLESVGFAPSARGFQYKTPREASYTEVLTNESFQCKISSLLENQDYLIRPFVILPNQERVVGQTESFTTQISEVTTGKPASVDYYSASLHYRVHQKDGTTRRVFLELSEADRPENIRRIDADVRMDSVVADRLRPCTSYQTRVVHENQVGSRTYGEYVPFTTRQFPVEVTYVTPTQQSSLTLILNDADIHSERRLNHGFSIWKTADSVAWHRVIPLLPELTQYELTGLDFSTSYSFRGFTVTLHNDTLWTDKILARTASIRMPEFSVSEKTAKYIVFQCTNYQDYGKYPYGVYVRAFDRYVPADEAGRITVGNLTPGSLDYYYGYVDNGVERVLSQTYVIVETEEYTVLTDTCEEVSPKAAFVKGYVGYNRVPESKFEYRKLDASPQESSLVAGGVVVNDSVFAVLFLEEGEAYQYRVGCKIAGVYCYGAWKTIASQNINTGVVKPHFIQIATSKKGTDVMLGTTFIEGENDVVCKGFKYFMEGISPDVITLNATETADPLKGMMLSYTFETLMEGYSYLGMAYAETEQGEYYSRIIRFKSDGSYELTGKPFSGIGTVRNPGWNIGWDGMNLTSGNQDVQITVFSLSGMVVKQQTVKRECALSLSDLYKGVYMVRVCSLQNGECRSLKIVKSEPVR